MYLLVLVNHQTADIVYISTLLARAGSGPHRGRASFMFFRPFVDRTCIATGNGVSKSIFRRSQDAGPLMLSDLSDLQKLYSVHVARCHRYQGGRVSTDIERSICLGVARIVATEKLEQICGKAESGSGVEIAGIWRGEEVLSE